MNPVSKNKRAKSLIALLSFVLLSACAVSKESFDCPAGLGVGCKSIHEVNQLLNEQNLGAKDLSMISATDAQSLAPALETSALSMPIPAHLKDKDSLLLQRVPERALSIWFAPFSDAEGHLHEASTVHVLLKPSTWQIEESF